MSSDLVEVSGPWFDGRATDAIRRYEMYAEEHVAEEGRKRVAENLNMVLRHQTGRYVGELRAHPEGESWVIDDGILVYGPWLEGTGSRNSPNTRFPGYSTFRRTFQQLDAEAVALVDPIPAQFMGAMNE